MQEPPSVSRPYGAGIMGDFIAEVFGGSDIKVRPEVAPWARVKNVMHSKNDWVIYSSPYVLPPSGKVIGLPLFPFDHVQVSTKKNSINAKSPSELIGKSLLLINNYGYRGLDAFLASPTGKLEVKVRRVVDPFMAIQGLLRGMGDLYIEFGPRALHAATVQNRAKDLHFENVNHLVELENIHFAVSSNIDPKLQKIVEEQIERSEKSGALAMIRKKWGLGKPKLGPNSLIPPSSPN
jgi:hypothetical protein